MEDDDDFAIDADTLDALSAIQTRPRVLQPTPQKLDRPTPKAATSNNAPKVVQPTPQPLPARGSGSSILVSPRQKGNPVLTNLRGMPWEYSDIPADYVLGVTTCALFLSLKYHRLHPEYIYNRIRGLQGKYALRVILTMVDIPNHEDSLKELSKTSIINNVTVILCWSAAEAARYLELYKSFEHTPATAIRTQQSSTYKEALEEFVTVPRSINTRDAALLISNFGSLRAAVNAAPEELTMLSGWGEKKAKAWCEVVQEPFRIQNVSKHKETAQTEMPVPLRESVGATPNRDIASHNGSQRLIGQVDDVNDADATESLQAAQEADIQATMSGRKEGSASLAESTTTLSTNSHLVETSKADQPRKEEELSSGVAAALARLRNGT